MIEQQSTASVSDPGRFMYHNFCEVDHYICKSLINLVIVWHSVRNLVKSRILETEIGVG